MYAFTASEESLCYLEGEKLLAVSTSSFHNSFIIFYKPLDFALKKNYSHERFSFNSPSNCYDYSYINDLHCEDIDLHSNYYLRGFPTLAAKEKFFNGTFEYLDEHTYNFNEITIKFDKREITIEEAVIERDIFLYHNKPINIIGKNIENVKYNIIKIAREYGMENNENTSISFFENLYNSEKVVVFF